MRVLWMVIGLLVGWASALHVLGGPSSGNTRAINSPIVIDHAYDPAPKLAPKPALVVEAEPEVLPEAVPEPTPEPEPEITPEPIPESTTDLVAEVPVASTADEASEQPAEQPVEQPAEQATEPPAEPSPEPAGDALPEPTGEIVIDLTKLAGGGATAPPAEAANDPGYEIGPDGSITLRDGLHIPGSGTADDPFVLGWAALRSVERSYNPRKGRSVLPAWLDAISNKAVRIEGNTLVPVVAQSTQELLVMQNPWDGCCIGVPPTPFDAIEVELTHEVDFGYTSVGYGVVTGTFVVDPYVVDGWVMGVYMIKDGAYESEPGAELPAM